jgi:hypothetical protein
LHLAFCIALFATQATSVSAGVAIFNRAHARQTAAQAAIHSRNGIYFWRGKRFFTASFCAAET